MYLHGSAGSFPEVWISGGSTQAAVLILSGRVHSQVRREFPVIHVYIHIIYAYTYIYIYTHDIIDDSNTNSNYYYCRDLDSEISQSADSQYTS